MSIIVVFQSEDLELQASLDAMRSNIPKEMIQVLLVAQEATEECLTIAKRYVSQNTNFELVLGATDSIEAKNIGIAKAKGQYIMFLNPGDIILPSTVERIVAFYNRCRDEVSMMFYKTQTKKSSYLLSPEVDSEDKTEDKKEDKTAEYAQDTIIKVNLHPYHIDFQRNYVFKNKVEGVVRFKKRSSLYLAELEFFMSNIEKAGCVAYCQGDGVITTVGEDEEPSNANPSIGSSSSSLLDLYNEAIEVYEELFEYYGKDSTSSRNKLCSGILLKEMNKRLIADTLFPVGCATRYPQSYQRYRSLINRMDYKVIQGVPISKHNKLYFMSLKEEGITFRNDSVSYGLFHKEEKIASWKTYGAYITYLKVQQKRLELELVFYNPGSMFWSMQVYMYENGEEKKISLTPSTLRFGDNQAGTGKDYSYYYTQELQKLQELKFVVEINGQRYPVKFYPRVDVPYGGAYYRKALVHRESLVKVEEQRITRLSMDIYQRVRKKIANAVYFKKKLSKEQYKRRKRIEKYRKTSYVYIGMREEEDLAWQKYCNEKLYCDGIKRTFLAIGGADSPSDGVLFLHTVEAQLAFSVATIIYTSKIQFTAYSPFTSKEVKGYSDLWKFQIVYLCEEENSMHPWLYGSELFGMERLVCCNREQRKELLHRCGYRKEQILEG